MKPGAGSEDEFNKSVFAQAAFILHNPVTLYTAYGMFNAYPEMADLPVLLSCCCAVSSLPFCFFLRLNNSISRRLAALIAAVLVNTVAFWNVVLLIRYLFIMHTPVAAKAGK